MLTFIEVANLAGWLKPAGSTLGANLLHIGREFSQ